MKCMRWLIVMDTVCQGVVPAWWESEPLEDGSWSLGYPTLYLTREEAEQVLEQERQLAEEAGLDRDEDFVVAVQVLPDGGLSFMGRLFTRTELEALRS